MKLLRSLISLEIQESKDEPVHAKAIDEATPTDTSATSYQSAKNLIHHKHLPQYNKPSKLFAYSSVHLSKHKKHVDIDNKVQLESQSHSEEKEYDSEICLELQSNEQSIETNKFHLTLPSDFDLNKLQDTSLGSISCITSNSNKDLTLSDSTLNNTTYTLPNVVETDMISTDNDLLYLNDINIGIFPKNDFKFMYNISHGAFGIVHKEFHLPSCQIVAIKHCRSTNLESINSFKKEIKICKEFTNNKYIINMIEYGFIQQEHKVCIALEYMNMSSLNKNKFMFNNNTVNRIKYVCVSVLEALKCLHNKLYIHNDIKPENILINDNCDIKITDFGCIKQMKDINSPLSKPIGTEYYQSYEKRFISPVQYTTKTDIYSFGITICELLLSEKQINKDIITPFEIPKEIIEKYNKNNNLIDFLHKCLNKNYKQRWNALQLLNHSFLKDLNNIKNCKIQKIEDMDDLEFMTNTLIDYYRNYKYEIDSNIDKNINISVSTPIDNALSDYQRIKHMAETSGYSMQFVHDYISNQVTNVKNKLLKM